MDAVSTVTVGPRQQAPEPPAGTVWVLQGTTKGGMTTLYSTPTDGNPDPKPPAGHSWKIKKRHGVRIYIPCLVPFKHAL